MDTLSQYDDYELSFLLNYNLNSFMLSTQNAIKEEALKRNLTKERQIILIKERTNKEVPKTDKTICPRCKTKKIIITKEPYTPTIMSRQTRYYQVFSCGVCGYNKKELQ